MESEKQRQLTCIIHDVSPMSRSVTVEFGEPKVHREKTLRVSKHLKDAAMPFELCPKP
jgi:hypothetical protein